MLVVFTSDIAGRTGLSSNLALISTSMSLRDNKLLLINSSLKIGDLEKYLIKDLDYYLKGNIESYGFEPIFRLIKNGLLNIENISDYFVSLLKNDKFDFLIGSKYYDKNQKKISDLKFALLKIIELSEEIYDYVFMEIPSDFDIELKKLIFENSDIVFYNSDQSEKSLKVFEKFKDENKNLNLELLIGRYIAQSRLNKVNIKKLLKLKSIYSIPIDKRILDSTYLGILLESISLEFSKRKKEASLYDDLNEVCKKIEKLGGKNA